MTRAVIAASEITGVILCGGDARRMHGVAKPLQVLNGQPLVQHVRERLAPQVARVIISANQDADRYGQWGDTVVADVRPHVGPLGGIEAALAAVSTPYAFVCPGDAPHLPTSLVARLAPACVAADADVAYPHDGTRSQQLFCVMRTVCRDTLGPYLDSGRRAVLGWLESLRTVTVDASDLASGFLNINSLEDLTAAAQPPIAHTLPLH